MRKAVHVDERNYEKEARDLVRGLSDTDKYTLYKIVLDKQRQYQTEEKDRELQAVRKIIERDDKLDIYRLKSIARGYKSSMAHDANGHDLILNNNPKRKKS